jgi:hypothetical protein
VWLSLKTLRSRVMASFAGHRYFLAPCGELSMFPSTVTAYFQLEGCVWLAIYRLDPTIRLAHQFVLAQCQISFLTFEPCPQATPTFHPALGGAHMHAIHCRFTVLVRVDSLANFWTCHIVLHCSQRADGLAPSVFIQIVAADAIDFSLAYSITITNREQGRPAIGPILHHVPLTAE